MEKPIIEVENSTVTYKGVQNPTLKNISFTINRRDVTLILGSSGSGTLCLNGLILYSYPAKIEGHILVVGIDSTKEPLHKISSKVCTV